MKLRRRLHFHWWRTEQRLIFVTLKRLRGISLSWKRRNNSRRVLMAPLQWGLRSCKTHCVTWLVIKLSDPPRGTLLLGSMSLPVILFLSHVSLIKYEGPNMNGCYLNRRRFKGHYIRMNASNSHQGLVIVTNWGVGGEMTPIDQT